MFYVAHYKNVGCGCSSSAMCCVGRVTNLWLCRRSGTGRVNFPLEMFTQEFLLQQCAVLSPQGVLLQLLLM